MKNTNTIFNNVKKHLNIQIVKPNLNVIDSIDWLDNKNLCFQENIKKPILTNDVLNFLLQLDDYHVLEFLVGFHSLNFQFWTPINPTGFKAYINNGLSGFYACLASYFALFKHLPHDTKSISFTQVDFFNFFGDIPNSKERFQILLKNWTPEVLDNIFQIIKEDSKDNYVSIDCASKVARILPLSFDDLFLRKAIYLLWDYIDIINKKNLTNIITDFPLIADHQTAKILSMNNLITYSENLKLKINNGILIENNSKEELAIRACIIFTANQICKRKSISTEKLYNLMWHMRTAKQEPFFLCESNNY